MTISSIGVGSGLDVNSIVTQLVAIEKQPLQPLQAKASTFQTQLSLYGTLKSQAAALGDAAAALATADGWGAQQASSSNPAAVTIAVGAAATSTSFSLEVTNLARAQTSASISVATGGTLAVGGETGTGILTIEAGSWKTGAFVANVPASSVPISGIEAGFTLSQIRDTINAANAGVTATVLSSGTQERLVFRSSSTGETSGFRITSDGGGGTFTGLDRLSFTTLATSASDTGMVSGQTGLNAAAKFNGLDIDSATNTFKDVVPGVTLTLNQQTTAPVEVTVVQDLDVIQKKAQAFADAYTTMAKTVADSIRYVPGGVSGALQGDGTTVGLQTLMRSVLSSSTVGAGTFSRLSDVGLEQQTDGSLTLNATKFKTAMADMTNLQKLFTVSNIDPGTGKVDATTSGFGIKMRDMARGLVSWDGRVTTKTTAIQGAITRNTDEQDRVNSRAARVETALRKQYSALDVAMSKMSSLSSYVTAQLAQWNKPSA